MALGTPKRRATPGEAARIVQNITPQGGPAACRGKLFLPGYLKTYFACAPTMFTPVSYDPLINP